MTLNNSVNSKTLHNKKILKNTTMKKASAKLYTNYQVSTKRPESNFNGFMVITGPNTN
jgi:hypothetical protein